MQNDYKNEIPIEELRYRYLRKHPLPNQQQYAQPQNVQAQANNTVKESYQKPLDTPMQNDTSDVVQAQEYSETGSYSQTTQVSNEKKRSAPRLVLDILVFTAFMLLCILSITSFININGTTYGAFEFVRYMANDIKVFFENISDVLYNLDNIGGSYLLYQIVTSSILLVSALEIGITTIVCFIIAICNFSKKNSSKLLGTVLHQVSNIVGVYMLFTFIDGPYKIDTRTTLCMLMLVAIMFFGSFWLFFTNKTATKLVKKQWISNIIFVFASIISLFALTKAVLYYVVFDISILIFNPSSINMNNEQIASLLYMVASILLFVLFSNINGKATASLKFLSTYGDSEADQKTQSYKPLKPAITVTIIGGIAIALIAVASYMLKYNLFITTNENVLVVTTILMALTIVSSAILQRVSKPDAYVNKDNVDSAPTPVNVTSEVSIINPVENPIEVTPNAPAETQAEDPKQKIVIKIAKPKPVPVEKAIQAPIEPQAVDAPKPKVVIRIPKPKQK